MSRYLQKCPALSGRGATLHTCALLGSKPYLLYVGSQMRRKHCYAACHATLTIIVSCVCRMDAALRMQQDAATF